MFRTPTDVLDYILIHDLEASFMNALAFHVDDYTIGEIVDCEWKEKDGHYKLISKGYSIHVEITDDDILTALMNKIYVTPFLSRHHNAYQVHFLVHQYPVSMKAQFDEQILQEVIQYMILKAIVALRLDTEEKLHSYLGRGGASVTPSDTLV